MKILYGETKDKYVLVDYEKQFFMIDKKEYRDSSLFCVVSNMAEKVLKGRIETVKDDLVSHRS